MHIIYKRHNIVTLVWTTSLPFECDVPAYFPRQLWQASSWRIPGWI